MSKFDSSISTREHMTTVIDTMKTIVSELEHRAYNHDASKLQEPEKSCYDTYIPQLKEVKYGSKDYNRIKRDMEDGGIAHHTQVNRHHPEHFDDGISGMTIVDLVEYFVDTYSASTKSDTPFSEGIQINQKKHNLPDELVEIFKNTVNVYF